MAARVALSSSRLLSPRNVLQSAVTYTRNYSQEKEHSKEEAKRTARLISIASGSAVAVLGGAYILWRSHFRVKADQGSVHLSTDAGEVMSKRESAEKDSDSIKKPVFRDRRIIAYEDRLKAFSTPDKVFRLCATLKVQGTVYMTPDDFVRSITPGVRQPDGLDLDNFKKLSTVQAYEQWKTEYEKRIKGKETFFNKLATNHLLSFSDYMFLLTVISTPKKHFRLAFKMFDTNGDGVLSCEEFEEVRVIVQSGTAVGARHKDHSVTGNVAGNISQSLSQYFFGSDQKGLLTIEKFEDFHDQLMEAILRLEFQRFDPNHEDQISEIKFVNFILLHSDFGVHEKRKFRKRLKNALSEEEMKGLSFEQVKDFSTVLDHLNDMDKALSIYESEPAALTQEEFKHVVRVVTGVSLDDHLVKVVFAIFDENGDGELSHKEFIEVLKDRRGRGLGKKKDLGFIRLMGAMTKCATKVVAERIHL